MQHGQHVHYFTFTNVILIKHVLGLGIFQGIEIIKNPFNAYEKNLEIYIDGNTSFIFVHLLPYGIPTIFV